jgi:hypothetical protein
MSGERTPGPLELETAAFEVGKCADFAGLISLAAEGLIADNDELNGNKFYAAAELLSDRLADLRIKFEALGEAWRRERSAAK